MARQLRSELKILTALPLVQLRSQADDLGRQIRDLDVASSSRTGSSVYRVQIRGVEGGKGELHAGQQAMSAPDLPAVRAGLAA